MAKARTKSVNSSYIDVIKGIISSLVMCILAILIYAVVLKSFSMSDSSIPYFNQVIKIAGILLASYYSVKKSGKLYLGLVGGVVFIIITYLLFSAINGSPGAIAILGSDIIMGAVIGTVFALITVKLAVKGQDATARK